MGLSLIFLTQKGFFVLLVNNSALRRLIAMLAIDRAEIRRQRQLAHFENLSQGEEETGPTALATPVGGIVPPSPAHSL
jgi:hypothetical protein